MEIMNFFSKLSIVYILTAMQFNFCAIYYIDAEYGKDEWNGKFSAWQSDNNGPWQTLSKVNGTVLSPGDFVLLKSGNIWREKLILQSGDSTGYITYSSYGNGGKPQIRRSILANNESQWININGNIWELDAEFPLNSDVAFISFNNNSQIGVKVWEASNLDTQNEFWTDETNNNRTKIYSAANPAALFNDIEVIIHEEGIRGNAKTAYVILENLHVCYCGWSGIELSDETHDVIIRNCDVSYIGGGHQNGSVNVRNGNGINTQVRAHDIVVEGCRIKECYDSGIALQGYWAGGLEVNNIYIHHNIIRNCEYSFEFWGAATNSFIHDIFFENNTCVYAGYGWSHTQRPDPKGTHIQNWRFNGETARINIRNNIFYEAQETLIRTGCKTGTKPGIYYNNNVFFKTTGDIAPYAWLWIYNGITYDYLLNESSDWQIETGWDRDSIFTDPKMADAENENYRLLDTSLCKNRGSDTGYLWDINATCIYRDIAYDLGAYEYINWRGTKNTFIDNFDNRKWNISDYNPNFWNYVTDNSAVKEIKEENGFLFFHNFGTDAAANLQSYIRRNINPDLDFFTNPLLFTVKGLNIKTENMDPAQAVTWILFPSETKDSYNCNDALRVEIKGDMSYSLAKKVNTSASGVYTILNSGNLQSLPVDISLSIDSKGYLLNFISDDEIISASGNHGISAADWNSDGSALFLQTRRATYTGDMKVYMDSIESVKLLTDDFGNNIVCNSAYETNFWYASIPTASRNIRETGSFVILSNFGPDVQINQLRSPLLPDINFFNSTTQVVVDGISMSGSALSNMRMLFISILSEENSSYNADDKIRVDIYGNNMVKLYMKVNGPGAVLAAADTLPALPHKIVCRIDKKYYDITFYCNDITRTFSGEHGITVADWGLPGSLMTGDSCFSLESKRGDTSGNTAEVKINSVSFSREYK